MPLTILWHLLMTQCQTTRPRTSFEPNCKDTPGESDVEPKCGPHKSTVSRHEGVNIDNRLALRDKHMLRAVVGGSAPKFCFVMLPRVSTERSLYAMCTKAASANVVCDAGRISGTGVSSTIEPKCRDAACESSMANC